MKRTVDCTEAQRDLGRLLDGVAGRHEHYVIERDGQPVAALVPYWLFEQWEARREAFFDLIEDTARRANMAEDEAMQLALEAVQQVRAEQRHQIAADFHAMAEVADLSEDEAMKVALEAVRAVRAQDA